jgi:hypothetical protein
MTDLVFLKALRDKLKGGNIRSIHLNALPGRFATRLDLGNFNYIKPSFSENFLNVLLSNSSFEFKISFDGIELNSASAEETKRLGLLSKRLNSLFIENEDNFKEHGIKTFAFGYPLLIKPSKQDPKKIIKAPIFIWQMEIVKSSNKVNTWSLMRNKSRNENGRIIDDEIHSVGLNEVLLSYLKTDENIIIPQINDELIEDAIISQEELINECFRVLKSLNGNLPGKLLESLLSKFKEPISNIPDTNAIESIAGNTPWIHFGGVFGLFRTQKESIITDIDKLIDRFNEFDFENLKVDSYSGTAQSAIETDPSQQEILSTLSGEPKKIIQGPPGTGKSQSLTALITNALANNMKCLVVCEKKTALDVIKNNLHKENDQLGSLAAVIEDINKDRDGIVNSVRDRLSNRDQMSFFNQTNYSNVLEIVETRAALLNKQHKQLDEKIHQGKAWTEIVGLFLKSEKLTDFRLLNSKLDYKLFNFQENDIELFEIIKVLKKAKPLYSEVKRLDHPLGLLHDSIFLGENPIAIKLKLEKFFSQLTNQINKVNLDLNTELKAYQTWIENHYNNYYDEIKNNIIDFKDFVKSNYNKYGELFYKNDNITKISSVQNKFVEKVGMGSFSLT